MRPGHGVIRLARSAAVALVCSVTAAVAHLSAGGEIPASSFTILFAGASVVAWLASVRRVTPGQLVGLLLLCQVCVHLGCSMGSMEMSVAMLATHVVATAASAAIMTRGESFVWTVAERLGLRLLPGPAVVEAVPGAAVPMPVSLPRSLKDVRLVHSRVLRGPPYGSS
ncbi:hypothetical protein GCM10022234_31980 [Aeromicrobium panaciterrae]